MTKRFKIFAILIAYLFVFSSCSRIDTNTSSDTGLSSLSETTSSSVETTTSLTTEATTSQTTQAIQAQTTPKAITKPASTTATQAQPPPKIIIPTVLKTTSPGTEAYANELGVIDASNKSQGYITVKYTGSATNILALVVKDGKQYQYNLPSAGVFVTLPLTQGNGDYHVYLGELVGSKLAYALDQNISVSMPNTNSCFLYPNQKVDFNQNSLVVAKSAEVCAGKNTIYEKIGAIFTYITSNITYDKATAAAILNGSIKVYTPNPDNTLNRKTGICYDYASLFAAMARAQGIPTKLIVGYASPDNLYHAWNEVYVPSAGWITVEIQLKGGFNVLDTTFYASSGNKAATVKNFSSPGYYRTDFIY